MFTIGICDDVEIFRQNIKEVCEQYFKEHPQVHEYIEFASGEEVLDYQESIQQNYSEQMMQSEQQDDVKMHLLFMDVEMSGINGIEVAKRVEEADWLWRIVFVTNHDEVMQDAFGIKTLGFATKPVKYEEMKKWIEMALRQIEKNVLLEYTIGTEKFYKKSESVYYLEADRCYTCMHTKGEKVLLNGNLKQWQKKMEQMPMVRIHKSYLVNMLHIKNWETKSVILTNGMELSVGRQYVKKAKEEYKEYIIGEMRSRM